MRGKNQNAGKELFLKKMTMFCEARYIHIVQKWYNSNSYSKMLKSTIYVWGFFNPDINNKLF